MDATNRYLDATIDRLGLTSDYQLSQRWKITRQRISQYRSGVQMLGVDRCFEIADILGISPELILFEVEADRAAKSGNTRLSAVFTSVLNRLAHAPAAIVCAVFFLAFFGASGDAAARPFWASQNAADIQPSHRIIYIMSTRLRSVFNYLRRLFFATLDYVNGPNSARIGAFFPA